MVPPSPVLDRTLALACAGIAAMAMSACTEEILPDACPRTTADIEGPHYLADAPLRDVLADANEPGNRIELSGRVLDVSDCETGLSGYSIEWWQADATGAYDDQGFRLRGQQFSKADGSYSIETIMPGSTESRPALHLHAKIRRSDATEVLNTQIYFDGDANLVGGNYTGPRVRFLNGIGELNFVVPK